MVLITGGGNGARQLNLAAAAVAPQLFDRYPELVIVHFAGIAHVDETQALYEQLLTPKQSKQVRVLGFADNFYAYSGAAEVIVARAGATNLAEFAVQGKACIVVPADHLVGGHQTKNARALAEDGSIVVLTQQEIDSPGRLGQSVETLLDDAEKRHHLETRIASLSRPDAAQRIAQELLAIIST